MVGKNRQGEVKNSMGNREAKELMFMAHGHQLTGGWGRCWKVGVVWDREGDKRERGIKGYKNWDSCNSIINKIYFKK